MSVIMKAERHRFVAPLRWERMAGGTKAGARLEKVVVAQGFVFSKPSLCLSITFPPQHLSSILGKKEKEKKTPIFILFLSLT